MHTQYIVGEHFNINVIRVEYIVIVTVIIVTALFGPLYCMGLSSNEVIKL